MTQPRNDDGSSSHGHAEKEETHGTGAGLRDDSAPLRIHTVTDQGSETRLGRIDESSSAACAERSSPG